MLQSMHCFPTIAHAVGIEVTYKSLGDSGFLQARLGAVVYRSDAQTHAFNTPYQLSVIPPSILARSKIFGGRHLSDLPKDALTTYHTVKHGDVLLFATDGVWDNLTSQRTLVSLTRVMRKFHAWDVSRKTIAGTERLRALTSQERSTTLQGLVAMTIASEAKMASLDRRVNGPFAREMQKHFPNEGYRGGKIDDICVIAVVALEDGLPEDGRA